MSDSTSSALLTGGFGYALASITGLLTANGGAAVVMVSLIGTVWGRTPEAGMALAGKLSWSLFCFGRGVGLAVLTAMASYISQGIINARCRRNVCLGSQIVACVIALGSLGAFGLGLWQASRLVGSLP